MKILVLDKKKEIRKINKVGKVYVDFFIWVQL